MLKVAVVDSGINAGHSHIGQVSGGISLVSPDYDDVIGHGTAVAAAIRDHEQRIELFAVKIFDRSFATNIDAVVKALQWCCAADIDVVNLSVGTAKTAHRDVLEEITRKVRILVAPWEFVGLPAYPGSFPWVFGVTADSGLARGAILATSTHAFAASPLPRTIPGIDANDNFSGTSFAVANFTGVICREILNRGLHDRDELRNFLTATSGK